MAASPAPIEAKEALLFDLPEPEAIDPAQSRARSTRSPRFLSSDRRQVQMLLLAENSGFGSKCDRLLAF